MKHILIGKNNKLNYLLNDTIFNVIPFYYLFYVLYLMCNLLENTYK